MLTAGDELGKTQRGNNNAYCQDSALTWLDWESVDGELHDIAWFTPDAVPMSERHWSAGFAKTLGVFLNGAALQLVDAHGERITDDCFYLLFNAHHDGIRFRLPGACYAPRWELVLDTSAPHRPADRFTAGAYLDVESRSLVVLKSQAGSGGPG